MFSVKSLSSLLCLFFLLGICQSQLSAQKKDLGLNYILQNAGCDGIILLYDYKKNDYFASNVSRSKERVLPASTFKILNTLMFLELGIVKDTSFTLAWDGKITKHKFKEIPSWYKDTNLADAFRNSTVWYYKELSKTIDLLFYKKTMKKLRYGKVFGRNKNELDFWNQGKKIGISAKDQIKLLVKIHEYDLHFKKEHIDIVKELMIEEQNEFYTLRSKTGWTLTPEKKFKGIFDLGWYIGYVESEKNTYFFAVRLEKAAESSDEGFAQARKTIAKKALSHMFQIEVN